MIQNTQILQSVTQSYIILLSIFAIILVIGSVKSIVHPDATVYAPGKYIALYNPESNELLDVKASVFPGENFKPLQANVFSDFNISSNTNCQ